MKKVIWIVVVVLVVLFISGSCSAYNRMVTAEETVNTTWADVEAQYQRRSDLIPNLVNTVKGYAAHEQSTFTEVVEARAQAMSFKLDAADLTPEKLAEFQQAKVYININNPFVFTPFDGQDPQVGTDKKSYPSVTSYQLGVNLNF